MSNQAWATPVVRTLDESGHAHVPGSNAPLPERHFSSTLASQLLGCGLEAIELLIAQLVLRHGLEGEGSGHRDAQNRRGHSERGRDAEVHQQGHQDDHVQGQPVDVVDGRPHVLRHDISLQGAHHRKVEPHARFKHEEGTETDLDVLHEEDRQVARRRAEHHGQPDLLHGHRFREVGVQPSAQQAEDHEAREDVTERRHGLVGLHQAGSPVEDKDEHGRLEGAADETAEQDLLVFHDGAQGLAEAPPRVPGALAEVLRPAARDVEHAEHEHHVGEVEGRDIAAVVHAAPERRERSEVRGDLSELPSSNRRQAAAEVRQREGVAELLAVEALALRLRHEPGVEHAEQQRRGDAAQDAAQHQHAEKVPMLGRAVAEVYQAVQDGKLAPPALVGERADDGAKDCGGAEAPDEEVAVVLAVDAVPLV
mmetsp:Transcript_2139/g.5629  ORF Transcript_2139/g.5629 Transcript_2139/m.5629 type:complete len:423 (+) Transcript_2139:292-1560(+)